MLLTATGSAQTPWLQSHRLGNEVRFLYSNLVRRYDLATKSWLPDIPLPRSGATAFTGDDLGNAVAYGTSIYLYNPAWSDERASGNVSEPVAHLFLDDSLLIAIHRSFGFGNSRISTFSRDSATIITTRQFSLTGFYAASHAPGLNRLYGRSYGSTSTQFSLANYTTAGTITSSSDVSNSTSNPSPSQSFVFPDERRFVDSNGIIYTTETLLKSGSFGGPVTDIDWNGDVPIVIRGTDLIAFRNTITEAGRVTIPAGAAKIAVTSSDAFLFRPTTTTPTVQIVPLGHIEAPNPGEPLNPNGLAFSPANTFIDINNVIHFYSWEQMALFPWSLSERKYLPAISLPGTPYSVSYSAPNHSVYYFYFSNRSQLRKIDLASPSPQESFFASLPFDPWNCATAGNLTFTDSHDRKVILSAAGTVLDDIPRPTFRQYESRTKCWDPTRRRMFHFATDGVRKISHDSIDPDGKFTGTTESETFSEISLWAPILVSPDGNLVVIGSGFVFNADNLTRIVNISNPITDGVWLDSTLVSIALINGVTHLQTRTGPMFSTGPIVRQFPGSPVRIFNSPSGLVVITSVDGVPRFHILDDSFSTIFTSPATPRSPGTPFSTTRSTTAISLSWSDLSDNDTGFRIDFRPAGALASWTHGASTAANTTSATVTGLTANTIYEFRIVAINGILSSPPSAIITSKTLASDDEPTGEPYNLMAIRRFHNSITISWTDNATNESGFRISRSLSPSGPSTSFVVNPSTTTFTDSSLSPSSTYLYRIQAFNGTTDGDLSSPLSAQTLPSASPPPAPSNLAASDIAQQQLTLSWSDNSFNEDSFLVEFQPARGGNWTTAGTFAFNTTSCTVTGLTPGSGHNLRVRAINSSGTTYSSAISATTQPAGGTFLNISSRSSRFYCFAFAEPFRIERFDLNSLQWLSPLPMSAAATALCIDDSGIFTAENRNIVRWNLDGSNRTVLTSTTSPVSSLFTSADILGVFDGQLRTYQKSSGAPLSSISTPEGFSAPSSQPSTNRIFFRGPSASIPTLHAFDFSPDGTLASSTSAPRPASAYTANTTWSFPDGTRVIDSAGNIHGARALAPITSIPSPSGTTIMDVAFHGNDIPVILRSSGSVTGHQISMVASGTFSTLLPNPRRLALTASSVIIFLADGTSFNGFSFDVIPLSSLYLPTPGLPVNPAGLTFSPSNAFIDSKGSLRIVAPSMMSLFTWSPSERKYTGSLKISGPPLITSYQPALDRFYYSEGGSSIRMASLSNPPSPDQHFTTLPNPVGAFVATDNLLCASAFAATTATHHVYNASGQLTASSASTSRANFLAWDPVNQQLSFLLSPIFLARASISPSGLYTPEPSRQLWSSATAPFRFSPDSSLIAFPSGHLIENISTPPPRFFDGTPTDLVWQNRNLVAIEPSDTTMTRVQRWSTSWVRDRAAILTGSPWRIFQNPSGGFIVITTAPNSAPRIHLLNQNLEPQFDSGTSSPLTVRSAPTSQRVDFGDPASFQILVTGTPPFTYRWSLNGTLIPGATESQLTIPRAGSLSAGTYQVTVSGAAGTSISRNATLAVGPVQSPGFLERSLLVSGANLVSEFTEPLFNTVRSSYSVPLHPTTVPASSTRTLAGAATDRLGRLHVLSHASGPSNATEFLNTYDPALSLWTQRMLPGPAASNRQVVGDLRIMDLWAVTQRGRLHTTTGEWRPFPTSWIPSRVAIGPDQLIYGMNPAGSIRVFDAASNSWNIVTSLPTNFTYNAFAVSPDGNFHTVAQGSYRSFGILGTPIRSLTPASPLNALNLAIQPSGSFLIATGSISPTAVSLTQTDLVSESRVTISSGISTIGTYAGWVGPIATTRPTIVSLSTPPALSGSPWSWKPEISHPDPDAVLSITISNQSPWLSLSNGILSGTPLASNVGHNPLSIRVSDSRGNVDERFFSIPVFAKNDPPLIPAAIPDISASDSASDQLISFAPFASDPDSGDSLTWRIIANSNPALFSSLSFDPQGRLAIRYAPYLSGTATISVSVTDRFGASAQRSLNISVPALPAPTITSQTPPSLNPLTGLWELPVTIQNIAQRAIGGFSLSTSSLPQGTSLYNASNAVSPSPTITDARPLNPGQSLSLTLEFLHPSQDPLPSPTLSTTTSLPRPALPTPFAIDRASFLSPESLLLEFPSEPGTLYQIQHSDDNLNWIDSLSRIRAAGTSTQWIDSGAPRTTSPPGSGSRFYRVKRLPAS